MIGDTRADVKVAMLVRSDSAGTYQANILGTNNVWTLNGTNTVPVIRLSEGFWLNKPGNSSTTWTVNRPIW